MAGNLVLTRRTGESVIIRNEAGEVVVIVAVQEVRSGKVKLLFQAPPAWPVNRQEIDELQQRQGITCPHCQQKFEHARYIPHHPFMLDGKQALPVCPGTAQDPLEVRQARDEADVIEKGGP